MFAVKSLSALTRAGAAACSINASPVYASLTIIPVRHGFVSHGGGQGDMTRFRRIRLEKTKYHEIPRIPGVTYMPPQGGAETGLLSPDENQSSAVKAEFTLEGPKAVNPEFFNRNPRNLEMMNIAMKRTGWELEADPKDYYNKIVFERTPYHTIASVVHTSGRVIVSASTEEFGISKFLYRTTDISAARNIGRVLGRRMLETGIMNAFCGFSEEERKGNRVAVFLQELQDSGIQLQEGERIISPNPYGGLDARRIKTR